MEHQARKSRRSPASQSQSQAPASRRRGGLAADVEAASDSSVMAEQFRLDDMYVIDSAGEYSVSGDDDDRPVSKNRPASSSDDRRRMDFELFLSYLRSVDCNFQEVVHHRRYYSAGPERNDLKACSQHRN